MNAHQRLHTLRCIKRFLSNLTQSKRDTNLMKVYNRAEKGIARARGDLHDDQEDMFAAGGETSSTTIEWAISELLKDPTVMKRTQDEVRNVYYEKGNVDESMLDELKYLKAVVKETLRLHPPAVLLLPRECNEKCEINGYEIPAKTTFLINAWAIGRDPKYWTDADKFNPDRFLESMIDYKGNHFQYVPFGGGRRICPGISFAIPSVQLSLAQMLFHFDWKLSGEMVSKELVMTEKFGLTVRRKNDLQVIAIPYHLSCLNGI